MYDNDDDAEPLTCHMIDPVTDLQFEEIDFQKALQALRNGERRGVCCLVSQAVRRQFSHLSDVEVNTSGVGKVTVRRREGGTSAYRCLIVGEFNVPMSIVHKFDAAVKRSASGHVTTTATSLLDVLPFRYHKTRRVQLSPVR